MLQPDVEKINAFYENEGFLLENLNKKFEEFSSEYSGENDKNQNFILETIEQIKDDLVFKDYLTYYLQKYRKENDSIYNKDDKYHILLEYILKL